LLKIAFDEEVVGDNVETFRKLVNKFRNPASVFQTHFAKKTLMKTAKKAGIKTKQIVDEHEYESNLTADPKNLEKLLERAGYQDYVRQGLGSLSIASQRDRANQEPFRISSVNANFSVCRSYPPLFVVPQSVPDDSIRRFARTHRQCRFPVITWRHSRTKALLLRASSFHSRGLMGMLKHNSSGSTTSGETTSSVEQEKYFKVLVAATPNSARTGSYKTSFSDSLDSLDSLMMSGATGESLAIPETPDPLRRTHHSSNKNRSSLKLKGQSDTGDFVGLHLSGDATPNTVRRSMFSRAVDTLRSSGGKGGNLGKRRLAASLDVLTLPRRPRTRGYFSTLTRIGSVKDKSKTSTFDPARFSHPNGDLERTGDLINSSVQGLKKVSLYVLGEKSQMKGVKLESFPKCDFIPVDFYEVRHVKASFKKLSRACVPSSTQGPDASFHKAVEESGWLPQIQNVLQLAGATVDLLDVQGSSVMICLEDGWDITTQVVSVAEVLLDPYYRTMEGFRALIEKEWLAFGHRFTHRSNQTQANQASGFAPVFLQFLDVIHQVHSQFPLSFEFNQYFLKFLAYHYVSSRFRTFMMDNEFERMEAGWLLEGKKMYQLDDFEEEAGFSTKHIQQSNVGASLWEYIEKHHRKSPIFYNFMYSPGEQDTVLRPYSYLSNLKLWDYYTTEDLAHGPSYDIEIVHREIRQNEDSESLEMMGQQQRKIINGCYDNVMIQQPDHFCWQYQEINKLENDLGHLPRKWKVFWDKLQHPGRDASSLPRQLSFNMQLARSHGRSIHKRSTLEILVKGKMLGEAARMFGQPHRFEEWTYTTAVYCDLCSNVLWGLTKTGMHCTDCGYNCHEKCMPNVPKNCTKLKTVSDASTSNSSLSKPSGSEASSVHGGGDRRTSHTTPAMYERYGSSSGEHRTHDGYLYKKGALLKGWKQRWFVLDSMKHQLRWYDSTEDTAMKGFIDLSEVESVKAMGGGGKHIQGAPKKGDEGGFFEMKTTRRLYHFLAPDFKTAQEWIDKIQSCIQ
ncbi:myotubularin-related protein 5-like, partial [Ruditapes philippinarum]|uniref:myotubularin-related protein 5-like n=1 Tax=Ruditapes philippinarum TaxID=129788 RepID=UPI00295B2F79